MLRNFVLILFSVLIISSCSKKADDIPRSAKLCGDYLVSVRIVKIGMYHAQMFSRLDKKLVEEKDYIYPVTSNGVKAADLSDRVVKYDDNAIYLEGGVKLIACDASQDAERIQGVKGRVWVDCNITDQKNNRYYCTIYSAKDGSVLAKGGYVLNKFYWDEKERVSKYTRVKGRVSGLDYVYYGGVGITAKNKLVLMPEGLIDYPESRRSGLRVVYDKDGTVLKEEEY